MILGGPIGPPRIQVCGPKAAKVYILIFVSEYVKVLVGAIDEKRHFCGRKSSAALNALSILIPELELLFNRRASHRRAMVMVRQVMVVPLDA